MKDCPNCGGPLAPSATECDFCGLTTSEMGGGSSFAVPAELRLGDDVEIGKTFEDSLREQREALAASQRSEERERTKNRVLKKLAIGLGLVCAVTVFYQFIIKTGIADSNLNAMVMSATNRRYEDAHRGGATAATLLPFDPEPHYLDAGLYLVEVFRPSHSVRKPEENLKMAEKALKKALERDPEHAPSLYYLGVVRCLQDRQDGALLALQKSLHSMIDDPKTQSRERFSDAASELLGKLKNGDAKLVFYSGGHWGDGSEAPVRKGEIRVPYERYPTP
jgi:tetratricopeptide (TPR) repeat protein